MNKFLTDHFTKYVDYDFTANLEDELDAVSRGEKDWIPVMSEFWKPFTSLIQDKENSVQRKDVTQEAIDENCPTCGKPLSIRLGRNGRFIGCTEYPTCSYTRNLDGDKGSSNEPEIIEGRTCPKCESNLIIKSGKYGKFIGCSNYPACKHIEPLDKPLDTKVACPQCKTGHSQTQSAFGENILFLFRLSHLQLRPLECACRRKLPRLRMANIDH